MASGRRVPCRGASRWTEGGALPRLVALAALMFVAVPSGARAARPDRRILVQLAGGVIAFPSSKELNAGASFGLSVSWGPIPTIGLEAGYSGSVFTVELPTGANLAAVENGGYSAALVYPFDWPAAPYVLAGLGLTHRRLVGTEAADEIQPGTFFRVPLGIGSDLTLRYFTVGLRATYDFVFRDGTPGRTGDELAVTLRLGALF
ncbi:hypothetical protein [Vulgatibacter incomptus]|nr:hypothetical protein [Vulgatibacter incomptus]